MKKIIYIFIPLIIIAAALFAKNFLSPHFEKDSSLFSPLWKRGGGGDLSAEAAATKTGLVGYWSLDQNDVSYRGTSTTTYDRSGFNNHCSFNIGANTYGATSTAGKVKQALNFDGANDYLDCGTANSLKFGTGDYTASAWIKYSAAQNYGAIVSYWQIDSGWYAGYQMRPHPDGFMHALIGRPFAASYIDLVSDNSLQDGKWHFLTLVNIGTTSHDFYVDGILNDSSTLSSTTVNQTLNNFYIGRLVDTASYYFSGAIDDVRVYNRALSAQEVANLYNSAKINFEQTAQKTASSTNTGQLVGYWTMDSNDVNGTTYYDKSGFNNNVTSSGSPPLTTGKIKQALNLQGTPQYASAPSSPFNFGTGNFTASVWIKPNNAAATYSIFDKYNTNVADDRGWFIFESANVIKASIDNGSIDITGTAPIRNGIWYHIALVRNGNNAYTYVNGVQDGTVAGISARSATSAALLYIGAEKGTSQYFNGPVDDIRVYNFALSAQEVANLYNSAKVNFVNTGTKTGLVGYWTMDNTDRSRNLIYDKSGFNNAGTITGTTTSTGMIKQARTFNGTTDWINIGDVLDMDTTNAITLSSWIKTGSIGRNEIIMAKWDADAGCANNAKQSYLVGLIAAGQVEFSINSTSNGADNTTDGIRAVNDNKWHHIVFTGADGANGLNIYIDGVLDRTATKSGTGILNSPTPLEIGSGIPNCAGRATYIFNGSLDDVRVYNRALSAQEVANLYNSAKRSYQ